MRFGQAFFRWCRAALLAAGVVSFFSWTDAAQVIINGMMQEEAPAQTGFMVKKVDAKIIDALSDFNRYSEKQAWEKAFKAIEKLSETEVTGMIPSKDGF